MSHFVKLYATILDSTIWAEPAPTVKVWLTLLAMANPDGFVEGALTGVMRRAIVSREECETAIKVLESPDPDSKTPEHEGRRIERVEGGWKILNHRKYRDLRTEAQIATAQRVKQHRDKVKALRVTDVTKSTGRNRKKRDVRTEVEVDTETTTTPVVTSNTGYEFMGSIRPVWKNAYGGDVPPGTAKRLKPLVDQHGIEEVSTRLANYLAATDAQYASISRFSSTYGKWNGSKSETPAERQFRQRGYVDLSKL